ncbi:MAG: cyclic nucleotide-binding domain-containing protein [Erysipelotrichaceae bacterium]|nr:cyclic nucleotide-binding domain-containing protein [Erysipelotrichaceae bacterium]
MKKISDEKLIAEKIENSPYKEVLKSLEVPIFLLEYKSGEYIFAPWEENSLFQIVCQGEISIYYVRDDGSTYSLAQGSEAYCIGEMEVFGKSDSTVFTQAISDVLCLSFSISENREILMNNNLFLQTICQNMSKKLATITIRDAMPSSLNERVLNYLRYKCDNHSFKGMEKMAFHLHCSVRQLQRIMNEFEKEGLVKKLGKGSYQLEYRNE